MKRKRALVALLLLFYVNFSYGQENQLTTKQKVKDFLYAYSTLKNNYPFFGVRKRELNLDWLAKKNEYISKVEKTENDSAYIATLKNIFSDLNDSHVGFGVTRYGNEGYYKLYKKVSGRLPIYSKWAEMFENPKARISYWASVLKTLDEVKPKETSEKTIRKERPNYSDTILSNEKIAMMTIMSFNGHLIEKEKNAIDKFLHQIGKCKYLIINIQNNSGGSSDYWRNNIVKRLVTDTVIYKSYPVIKDGAVNRHFYSDFFAEAKLLKKTEPLKRIPTELIHEKFYIKTSNDTIVPDKPIPFKGKIFLLVSKTVFSSAEGLAQFCKVTGWATVVGERTGGDGVGSDPAIIMLPESGILMTYPSLVGLNHDGSINTEEKTTPDIEIKGANSQERLGNVIKYLNNRK